MQSRLLARCRKLLLKAGAGEHVTEDGVGHLAAGVDIAGVVNAADEAVVRVVVCSLKNLFLFFGHELNECEGEKIARESVAAGVGVRLFAEFADWMKGGVCLKGP